MQIAVCICAILAAMPALAAEHMTVSVCSPGHLSAKLLAGAESVAANLFHSAGIEIVWARCELGLEGDAAVRQHWFTVRFRAGRPFVPPALAALDTLGEAFTSVDEPGYIVEVYYEAVETLAQTKQSEVSTLLGFAMAHELGHLLLGPQHAPRGVMRAAWDLNDLEAMRQGCLRFRPAESARMRTVLHASDVRAAAP
jgi:hypothetical protein